MDIFFLACFLFGALFTIASAALGLAGSAAHAGGHAGDAGALGPGGHDVAAGQLGPGGHDLAVDHGGSIGHAQGHEGGAGHQLEGAGQAASGLSSSLLFLLSFFSVSSVLVFLTWFGATGFLLLRFAAWPLLPALGSAVLVGSAGSGS